MSFDCYGDDVAEFKGFQKIICRNFNIRIAKFQHIRTIGVNFQTFKLLSGSGKYKRHEG